jgi:serine/threonine-protein kinase
MGSSSLFSRTSAGPHGLPQSRLMVLLFSDIVGSTDLKRRIGTVEYADLLARHDQIFRQIVNSTAGAVILKDTGDGFFASFATASDAVRAALRFQHDLREQAAPLQARVGLHLGEVAELQRDESGQQKVVGMAADLAARLMGLALGGQILMTRVTFNDARQFVRSHPSVGDVEAPPLRWVAHGQYLFKGADEPMEVFEVGAVGIAPLTPPPDSDKARRNVRPGDELTLGWRPAGGLELRGRPNWIIREKLGEGGFGEVWLAEHAKTGIKRVFKFCFEPQRLRGLKREVVLFRLLKEALGDRGDIARIIDFQFDENPYFIETEYFPAGTLHDWVRSRGGFGQIPMAERISVVAKVADALAAAHSVGVLHKDLKPSNILMREVSTGMDPVITDFGIGILTDPALLQKHDITQVGFTQSAITESESSRTGTRIYAPPESLLNRPFTVQGDVYAVGVLLYQMVVGDLDRPLAVGWENDVEDELLREDIAACVQGDPARRLSSAGALASRLKTLDERRQARAHEKQAAGAARRRQWFVRALAAMLSVAILLALGLGVALVERSKRIATERDRAQTEASLRAEAEAARDRIKLEAEKAQSVTDFLRDMLTSADPSRTNNPDLKVREALDRASRGIEVRKFSPQIESVVRAAIGRTYLTLGIYPQAEQHLTAAVELARNTEGVRNRQSLKCLSDLGILYLYTGRYEMAESVGEEALRLREQVLGPDDPDTADSLFNLSLVYGSQRRYAEANEAGQRALAMREKYHGPDSAEVAQSLQYLAQYTNESGKFAEAEPLYRRSLELREKLLGPDHFEVGISHNNIGLVYLNTGRFDQAETHFARAVEVLTKSLGAGHPNVAMAKSNLANIYMRKEDYARGRPLIEDAVRITESAKGLDHPDLLFPLYNLATIYYAEKNYDAAEAAYHRTLVLAEKLWGPEDRQTISIRVALGMMYHDKRDMARAEPILREILPKLSASGRVYEAFQVEVRLAEARVWRGEFEQVEPVVLELNRRALDLANPVQARMARQSALQLAEELYRNWGRSEQAGEYRAKLEALEAPVAEPATAPASLPS